jgi:hypothetical protein
MNAGDVGIGAAPVLLRALFSDSGENIIAYFDVATDRAGSTSAFCCAELIQDARALGQLQPSCGNSTHAALKTCIFDRTDASGRTLLIGLGVGTSISPGSLLTLNAGVLFGLGGPVVSLTAAGSVVVDAAVSPTPPTCVVTAPSQVGVCQDTVLDGSSSSSGGGAVLKFVWSSPNSTSPNSTSPNITAADSLASRLRRASVGMGLSVVTIASLDAAPGLYFFTLVVTNSLGASASSTIAVYRSGLPMPEVAIAGPRYVQIESDSPLELAAVVTNGVVTSPPCKALMGDGSTFDIRWSLISSSSILGAPTQSTINGWQGRAQRRKLSIPSNMLQAGNRYEFRVTATSIPRYSLLIAYTIH